MVSRGSRRKEFKYRLCYNLVKEFIISGLITKICFLFMQIFFADCFGLCAHIIIPGTCPLKSLRDSSCHFFTRGPKLTELDLGNCHCLQCCWLPWQRGKVRENHVLALRTWTPVTPFISHWLNLVPWPALPPMIYLDSGGVWKHLVICSNDSPGGKSHECHTPQKGQHDWTWYRDWQWCHCCLCCGELRHTLIVEGWGLNRRWESGEN